MPETVRLPKTKRQLDLVREEQQQRAEKINLLKEQLKATMTGHRRRMTEVKTQNMNRLNIIRRFIDEATAKTHPTQEKGKRNSEPVSPSPSDTGTENQENLELLCSSTKGGTLNKDTTVYKRVNKDMEQITAETYSELNENCPTPAPQIRVNNTGKEVYWTRKTNNRTQNSANHTTKAGHLAMTVLKHFYSSDGCCPNHMLPELFQSRLDLANKAKEKAEANVTLLREQVEDLNIELKGLSNELKDTRRTYEERLYSYEKKYKAQIKGLKRQIDNCSPRQPLSIVKSKTTFSERPLEEVKRELDGSNLLKNRVEKRASTQFDQVISSVFLSDNSNSKPQEWEEDAEEEEESELARLNDRVHELESEVEELRVQYTKEKSQRLHVMWCLEAKSRQVQNLLSVQEEHSQLLIQHSQLIEENSILRNKLEGLSEDSHDVSFDQMSNSQKLESKYALLQTAEIKRLRKALQRATELHPDLEDRSTPSPSILGVSTPRRRSIPLSQKKDHLRAKTVTVNLKKMVERNNPNEMAKADSTTDTSLAPNDAKLPDPSPIKLVQSLQDETPNDFITSTSHETRAGIMPYFVYTLQESLSRAQGPINLEEQQKVTVEATADKWASSSRQSPDLNPTV